LFQEFTKSGKRRCASYVQVCEWVSEAVKKLDKDLIIKSFTQNGLSVSEERPVLHSRLAKLLEVGKDTAENTSDSDSEISDSDTGGSSSEEKVNEEVSEEVNQEKSDRCRRIFFGGEDSDSGSGDSFKGFEEI
jgi:hypothetical protein